MAEEFLLPLTLSVCSPLPKGDLANVSTTHPWDSALTLTAGDGRGLVPVLEVKEKQSTTTHCQPDSSVCSLQGSGTG